MLGAIFIVSEVWRTFYCGVPPFVRATAAETAAAYLRGVVIPPNKIQPGVPSELKAIALRCLSKNPAQR